MNFKIENGLDLDKSEELLETYFKHCEDSLNEDLQKWKDKEPIFTEFKMDLNEQLKAMEKESENTRKIVFPLNLFKRLEAFYTHAFSQNNKQYYKMVSYDTEYSQEKAEFYKNLLLGISVKFLLLHEFGHIYNGHLLYMANEEMDNETHKLFEWNADDFATTRIVAMYAHPKVIDQLNNKINKPGIINLNHMLLLIIQATIISASLMNIGKKDREKEEKHIYLRQRLIYMLNNEIAAFNEFNYTQNDYINSKADVSDEMLMFFVQTENFVNKYLNELTNSDDWDIHNNIDELSLNKTEEVYKLKENYIEDIQNKLEEYARFDPFKKI